jgi:hypothetical protein
VLLCAACVMALTPEEARIASSEIQAAAASVPFDEVRYTASVSDAYGDTDSRETLWGFGLYAGDSARIAAFKTSHIITDWQYSLQLNWLRNDLDDNPHLMLTQGSIQSDSLVFSAGPFNPSKLDETTTLTSYMWDVPGLRRMSRREETDVIVPSTTCEGWNSFYSAWKKEDAQAAHNVIFPSISAFCVKEAGNVPIHVMGIEMLTVHWGGRNLQLAVETWRLSYSHGKSVSHGPVPEVWLASRPKGF